LDASFLNVILYNLELYFVLVRIMKVVQTKLEEEEYTLLKEWLKKEGKSIEQGIREVIIDTLGQRAKVSSKDTFFLERSARSGKKDVSKRHDDYLY